MVEATILSHPFFTEMVLPFLLVFTLIFAILEKTKILGDGKKQIDAIVSFVVALIFISFPYAVGITINLAGIMALIAVILLVFMVLYGFVAGKEFTMNKGLKITFGILIGLALIVSLLYMTGYLALVFDIFSGNAGGSLATNIFFILIIGAAIAIVMGTSGKGRSSGD